MDRTASLHKNMKGHLLLRIRAEHHGIEKSNCTRVQIMSRLNSHNNDQPKYWS